MQLGVDSAVDDNWLIFFLAFKKRRIIACIACDDSLRTFFVRSHNGRCV